MGEQMNRVFGIKGKIEGVVVKPLTIIPDERGTIRHMLRNDDVHFSEFGEIYFSTSRPGVIKGWHYHKEMTLNYAVVSGMAKIVLYDDREGSSTKGNIMEIFAGEENYVLVQIPPKIWNGYKNICLKDVLLANCASMPHDTEEILRLDPFSDNIRYDWEVKHG